MIQAYGYWLWLGITALITWWLPSSVRLWSIGLACLGYLAGLELSTTLVVTGLTVAFFWLPRLVSQRGSRRRLVLWLVCGALAYLFYNKLRMAGAQARILPTSAGGFVLPLGISYFTFKFIHYAVEMNRGRLTRHTFGEFLAYMSLVPIFTAGPIERFDHFLANRETTWSPQSLVEGLTRIVHGLIKRFVLAGFLIPPLLGPITSYGHLVDSLDALSPLQLWRCSFLLFTLVYLDFSAYSDIAIGGARLFGLRIMENFDWPILASDIGQFWKRWHMTLAGWCQAYVYMPTIGLTRNPYLSTYAAFLVIGLWHGFTVGWILWGLYHGTGIAVFVFWTRVKRRRRWAIPENVPLRIASTVMTLSFVSAGGVLPAVQEVDSLGKIMRVFAKLLFVDVGASAVGQ